MSEHYTPTTEHVREEFTYGVQGLDMDGNVVVSFDEAATGFDRWLAGVKAEALREAAEEMRRVKEPYHWNLPVAEESWASPDVWLERRAYEVKRGER